MSGATETLFYYAKRTFTIQTEPVPLNEAQLLVEFLESIDDGQSFTFDPYGTPDNRSSSCLVVISDDQGYTQERGLPRGDGGGADCFRFSFGVREL
jgi:hypothetical protein